MWIFDDSLSSSFWIESNDHLFVMVSRLPEKNRPEFKILDMIIADFWKDTRISRRQNITRYRYQNHTRTTGSNAETCSGDLERFILFLCIFDYESWTLIQYSQSWGIKKMGHFTIIPGIALSERNVSIACVHCEVECGHTKQHRIIAICAFVDMFAMHQHNFFYKLLKIIS